MRVPAAARRSVFQGAVLVMGQSMAMAMGLAWFNDPAAMNILYGTRGLWSLVLVWFAGRWFGNTERHTAQGAMGLHVDPERAAVALSKMLCSQYGLLASSTPRLNPHLAVAAPPPA